MGLQTVGGRVRMAAVGAVVAVCIGAGDVSVSNGAVSSGTRSVFVPIAPCRLVDLRPAPNTVGPRALPLNPGETFTQQITGTNGNCTGIPTDATAVSMNVTAVIGTAKSFLTVFPADLVSPPNVSNLNWIAGDPPRPNKVDVKLSPTGAIKIFNSAGTVYVIVDVVGYYQDHNHDDRYASRTQTILIPAFDAVQVSGAWTVLSFSGNCMQSPTATAAELRVDLHLPEGATLTAVSAVLLQNGASQSIDAMLVRNTLSAVSGSQITGTPVSSATNTDAIQLRSVPLDAGSAVGTVITQQSLRITALAHTGLLSYCGATATYVLPPAA